MKSTTSSNKMIESTKMPSLETQQELGQISVLSGAHIRESSIVIDYDDAFKMKVFVTLFEDGQIHVSGLYNVKEYRPDRFIWLEFYHHDNDSRLVDILRIDLLDTKVVYDRKESDDVSIFYKGSNFRVAYVMAGSIVVKTDIRKINL